MHRAIPVSNKLLSKKWDDINQAVHQEKLRSMRPQVDSASPVTFPHAVSKAKKEQLMEDRYTEIERENRLLLEKMSTIMQNHHSKERRARKRSLNQESRRREMLKITMENQALLRRLQDRQPSYSIHKWESDRKRTEQLLHNICEFPYQLGVTTYVGTDDSRKRYGSVEARFAVRSEIATAPLSRNLATARKPGPATGDRPRKLAPISKDDNKELLFKRGMNINDKYFLVEVSQVPGIITITAFDIESPDSYNLELGTREALELMGGEHDYERLVGMLAFEKGELMLIEQRREESMHAHPHASQRKHRPMHSEKRASPAKKEETKEQSTSSPKQKSARTPDAGKTSPTAPAPSSELPAEQRKTPASRNTPAGQKTPSAELARKTPVEVKDAETTAPRVTPLLQEEAKNGGEGEAFDLSQSADFGPVMELREAQPSEAVADHQDNTEAVLPLGGEEEQGEREEAPIASSAVEDAGRESEPLADQQNPEVTTGAEGLMAAPETNEEIHTPHRESPPVADSVPQDSAANEANPAQEAVDPASQAANPAVADPPSEAVDPAPDGPIPVPEAPIDEETIPKEERAPLE